MILWALSLLGPMENGGDKKIDPPTVVLAASTNCHAGVYLQTANNAFAPISETTFVRQKVSNLLGMMLVPGSSLKFKAVLPGPRAMVRTPSPRPVFRFCFDVAPDKAISDGAEYVGAKRAAQSPDDFRLVRLEARKDSREMPVAQVGLGGTTGMAGKISVPFQSTPEAPGQFAILPTQDLLEGQYGFVPLHSGPAAQNSAKNDDGDKGAWQVIYDFEVGSSLNEP